MNPGRIVGLKVVLIWILAGHSVAPASPPAGAPARAGRMVLSSGRVIQTGPRPTVLKPLAWVGYRKSLFTVGSARAKLLLTGGCVVRLGSNTAILLERAGAAGACPRIVLLRGSALLTASGRGWLMVLVGKERLRLRNGRGFVSAGGGKRMCALGARLEYWQEPSAVPAKPAEGSPPAPRPASPWRLLGPGHCRSGPTVAPAKDRAAMLKFPVVGPFVLPPVSLGLNPLFPKRRTAKGKGESEGPGQVSAAGGSMCLDSSGSGSAGDVQQGPDGIDKPPPVARVRIRVTVPAR
jgi:hypothetical protein